MKRNAVVALVIVVVIAGLLWAGWHNFQHRKQVAENQPPQVVLVPENGSSAGSSANAASSDDAVVDMRGKPAANFKLLSLDGKDVSLEDYKGKAVLVNFWATWCAPCKVEMPWLAEFRSKYAAKGFEVLGITEDDAPKAEVVKVVQKAGVNYPILQTDTKVGKLYGGLDYLPMSFYVGRDGKIVAQTGGLPSKDEMEANIKKALGE